jgi:hypothetical protein
MANLPAFRHIHCSSRFDRSPASLDFDIQVWIESCSLLTLTEVTNDNRAAQMRNTGWDYYNSKQGHDADNCGIAWRKDTWKRKSGKVLRLSHNTFDRVNGMHNLYIWAATVVLVHKASGHRLLVSVSHPPAHVEGHGGFLTTGAGWQARKRAYMTALDNWSAHVKDMEHKQNVDATLIIADWNVNLKDQWFRNLLKQKWGKKYVIAWKVMPHDGGALSGGPDAPDGSPGVSKGDRIIDGTLYRGVTVKDGPHQMARVRSSDHRPYSETFQFLDKGAKEDDDNNGKGAGDTYHGVEWWGFGDYLTDEMYDLTRATGEAEGEVL